MTSNAMILPISLNNEALKLAFGAPAALKDSAKSLFMLTFSVSFINAAWSCPPKTQMIPNWNSLCSASLPFCDSLLDAEVSFASSWIAFGIKPVVPVAGLVPTLSVALVADVPIQTFAPFRCQFANSTYSVSLPLTATTS